MTDDSSKLQNVVGDLLGAELAVRLCSAKNQSSHGWFAVASQV